VKRGELSWSSDERSPGRRGQPRSPGLFGYFAMVRAQACAALRPVIARYINRSDAVSRFYKTIGLPTHRTAHG